jgi:probable biosynthetic protein (TIGR04098 family)
VLTETVELNLRHLGLGDLDEFGALTLFADVHSHRITEGTGGCLSDIADTNDAPLYPAYYRTHVIVPPARLLSTHALWSRVSVGVDVRTFGGMLLESAYVLAPEGEVPEDTAQWDAATFPVLHANSMFILDDLSPQPRPSGPADGRVAELERATTAPEAMNRIRGIARGEIPGADLAATITPGRRARYDVLSGRDAARGHNMMFAQFVRVMDAAERQVLLDPDGPALSPALLGCLETLERETFYLGNCQAGETVTTRVRGRVEACSGEQRDAVPGHVLPAVVHWAMELFRGDSGDDRLAVATARRAIAVPAGREHLVAEADAFAASQSTVSTPESP